MAELVYILCAATSLLCAVLLLKGYKHNRMELLFWSALCFLGFALNNVILFIDMVLIPGRDCSILRIIPALLGICALIYGLIRSEV